MNLELTPAPWSSYEVLTPEGVVTVGRLRVTFEQPLGSGTDRTRFRVRTVAAAPRGNDDVSIEEWLERDEEAQTLPLAFADLPAEWQTTLLARLCAGQGLRTVTVTEGRNQFAHRV